MADLRNRALQLLTGRDYSRQGLRDRLLRIEPCESTVDALLDDLQAGQWLSDARYARQRALSRGARYGDRRLRQELQRQGVAEADIAAALPEAGDEETRCRTVWSRKFHDLPMDANARARQIRFLQYRGFSLTVIGRVLRGGEEA